MSGTAEPCPVALGADRPRSMQEGIRPGTSLSAPLLMPLCLPPHGTESVPVAQSPENRQHLELGEGPAGSHMKGLWGQSLAEEQPGETVWSGENLETCTLPPPLPRPAGRPCSVPQFPLLPWDSELPVSLCSPWHCPRGRPCSAVAAGLDLSWPRRL
ncbi:hypothetical protein DR999_PMT21330 [Platysternon megacephalum]|uniref:Uncharacterized protein n=1 Tax=Platysternon megacephalum TaxID=55544 RepID=A0A4D9DMS1_9SAUR|nr:hypothetical protein DR999_PMT21330 [Platysternon megacephalum]